MQLILKILYYLHLTLLGLVFIFPTIAADKIFTSSGCWEQETMQGF